MLKRNLSRLALGIGLAVATGMASAADYKLTRIDVAGAYQVSADDVNNHGQVVGSYGMRANDAGRAYVYDGGVMTLLSGPAGALGTSAGGISDGGVIVGSYVTGSFVDSDGVTWFTNSKGFIYDGGQYQTISLPWAENITLVGISPNGRYLSGWGFLDDGVVQGFAIDRSTGALTRVGDAGPDAYSLIGRANDAGILLGDRRIRNADGSWSYSAFSFDVATSQSTDLAGMAGSRRTALRDVNASGMLVGYHGLPDPYEGLVGTPGHYQSLHYGAMTALRGINDAGWLTGEAFNADGTSYGLLLTPVPEPTTAALCLGGLGVIVLRKRRRT